MPLNGAIDGSQQHTALPRAPLVHVAAVEDQAVVGIERRAPWRCTAAQTGRDEVRQQPDQVLRLNPHHAQQVLCPEPKPVRVGCKRGNMTFMSIMWSPIVQRWGEIFPSGRWMEPSAL